MKKTLSFALIFMSLTAFSQLTDNALGLRLGANDGFGTEITYQKMLGSANRLELDLGLRGGRNYEAFKITGIYQWVKPLGGQGFYWYAGFGAGVGVVNYNNGYKPGKDFNNNDDNLFLSVDGMLGIEYSLQRLLDIPIQLSLDLNPELELINDYYGNDFLDIAFSIRYQW
jgi:hypothetical protein